MIQIRDLSPDCRSLLWEESAVGQHFHISCVHRQSAMSGSGFAPNRLTSRKKAFVELNERLLVGQLKKYENLRELWDLEFDSSCSGFAAGYSRDRTILRSVYEACERWRLAKWVDEGISLQKVDIESVPSISSELTSFFSDITMTRAEVILALHNKFVKAHIGVVLGWTANGVFAGYGTKGRIEDALEHAMVEAVRNFLIYKNQKPPSKFPFNRILFFAENRKAAERHDRPSSVSPFSFPTARSMRVEKFGNIWLARTVLNDWIPWQHGSHDRFLY